MKKKLLLATLLIISFFIFIACFPKENPIMESNYNDMLLSQVNKDEDDFLSTYSSDYKKLLTFDTLHYGRFSTPHRDEMLAVFKIADVPHVGGLDRTIIAVFDAETNKIIAQKSLGADAVNVYCMFSDVSQTENIFIIVSRTNQGYTTYTPELFELKGETWLEKPINTGNTENKEYSFTHNALHIFIQQEQELNSGQTLEYLETFFWDEAIGEFVIEQQYS